MVKKYKVINAGLDGLRFPELMVKYSSGHAVPLRLRNNDYVPLEILDADDIKKSLLIGSLGAYIKTGFVVIEDDEVTKPKENKFEKQLKKELLKAKQDILRKQKDKNQPQISKKQEIPTKKKAEEPAKQVESEEKILERLDSIYDVKIVDDFFRLRSYFLKLEYLKICKDKALLQQIYDKSDTPQIKNNVQLRLSTM